MRLKMQTLQFTTHIENNAQINLTLPFEYANQDVELIVIIQPRQQTLAQQNWQAFINQSYGCLADDPLERPEQPQLTEIETLL
jgi:ribosome-associated toxin RatA of RatAB toxin-antitoxin module